MSTTGSHILYRRLARRNRRVRGLRVLVPLGGALVLAVLGAQIYLASFTGRFGIENISISPEAVTVDAPEYAGVLEDGSAYRVLAETARAATQRPDLIALSRAQVVLNRIDGVQMQADATQAKLDTVGQLVLVEGVAEIADSTGTTGSLRNSTFDWAAQRLTTEGPVAIDYADGTTLRAEGLVYDAQAKVWTFTRSVVTLPTTPGEDGSTAGDGEDSP